MIYSYLFTVRIVISKTVYIIQLLYQSPEGSSTKLSVGLYDRDIILIFINSKI